MCSVLAVHARLAMLGRQHAVAISAAADGPLVVVVVGVDIEVVIGIAQRSARHHRPGPSMLTPHDRAASGSGSGSRCWRKKLVNKRCAGSWGCWFSVCVGAIRPPISSWILPSSQYAVAIMAVS